MDGVFRKKRFSKVYNIIGLISGAFLVFFGFFICIGEFSTLDDMILSYFFVCFGFFVFILCGFSLYVNKKAYIHVDEERISAFCHLGLSLKCNLSDVSSVSYSSDGLNIQLKSGKKYSLMNLENSYQIGKYIQKRISIKPSLSLGKLDKLDKDELMAAIPPLGKKCKYEGIAAIICFLLLFPGIILTSGLTGWKELHEFNSSDWTIFSIMAGVGVITIVVFCILLRKYLLHTDELNKMQGALYQIILQTAPVQPGNAIKLFLDDDRNAYIRLTVYGYPDSDEVYYIVERVDPFYEMECVHKSRVYANIQEIAPDIEGMYEIPLP